MTVLASLEIFHSRPIAPTRRLALGRFTLPVSPPPGPGGILLGAIAARFCPAVEPDLYEDIDLLLAQLESGRRIVQPRLRHRLQSDRVGLLRSEMSLSAGDSGPTFDFKSQGSPMVCVLAAIYAASRCPDEARNRVLQTVRNGLEWQGPLDRHFIAYLGGDADGSAWTAVGQNPLHWALTMLGWDPVGPMPSSSEVRTRFRQRVREVHPDHGAAEAGAAVNIEALTEARRILLG